MDTVRVLVADDDPSIRMIAKRALTSQGCEVTECEDGLDALKRILSEHFDLILLDIDMGRMDGFSVLEKIRERQIQTPVLIITGNDEEYNEVYGFHLGADDYIIKPFRPSALSARAGAILRRTRASSSAETLIRKGPFVMNLQTFSFTRDGKEIVLTPKEWQLMQLFLRSPGQVFSKDQLFERIWKEGAVDDNTIMVTIRNLRKKIEDDPAKPRFLNTVYGVGYRFTLPS